MAEREGEEKTAKLVDEDEMVETPRDTELVKTEAMVRLVASEFLQTRSCCLYVLT